MTDLPYRISIQIHILTNYQLGYYTNPFFGLELDQLLNIFLFTSVSSFLEMSIDAVTTLDEIEVSK